MKKLILLAIVAATAAFYSFTVVPVSTWAYDTNHAKVGFTATHMLISDVEGYFKTTTATLTTSKADFTDAVVEMTAQASSIFTDNEKRDGHLQSADFFDAAQFPVVTFKSTSFKKSKTPNVYVVKGNLTMRGVTKPIVLTAIAKTGTNPMNKKAIAGFKITGKLNRLDFGIGTGVPAAVVSNEIQLISNAEFIKD